MQLNLERGDLLQLDPISHTGTLQLLPLGRKNKQKLLVGDDSGHLYCYEFKRGEPQIVFKTKVFDGAISSIALGGPRDKRDKVFLSHSQRIVGLTKKGKEFFKLTSSLTEAICNIRVEDTRIWTGCECIYNLFDNGADTAYYISKDVINDLLVAKCTRDSDYDTVLACQDSCIRVIHGSDLFLEIPTSSPVTALGFVEIESDAPTGFKAPTGLVYGAANGTIGFFQVFSNREVTNIWSVDDGSRRSPVTCLCVADLTRDGAVEVVVGRDDGRVEVFKQQPESVFAVPSKVFSKDVGESVRSVVVGVVGSAEYNEIIVATYSGKILSFTTEPVHQRAAEDSYGRSIQTINNENRIKHLRKEVEDMQKLVEKERVKLNKTNNNSGSNSNSSDQQFLAAADFPVNTKFHLDGVLAAYVLTIELQTAIDLIILRSPVVLELVETDTGTSVLSVTPPHLQQLQDGSNSSGVDSNSNSSSSSSGEDKDGKFVAVFRCQSKEKRIMLNLRTNEGEFGDLIVTIVADSLPKAAKIVKFDLKPLSLNQKVHELSGEEFSRPRNKMRYTGSVQVGTIHEWVQSIFPDVPPRIDEQQLEQQFSFRNTFTGAVTTVEYRKNEIIFESESASTIAIIKENITRLANYRRTALEEFVTAEDLSISSFLSLICPKLEHQISLARKVQLVDAVQEIAMTEAATTATTATADVEWLSEEYKSILQQQEQIRQEFKNRDKSLEFLCGIVTDLFVDWCKLQGQDAKQNIARLQQTILSGDFDAIVKMFPAAVVRK